MAGNRSGVLAVCAVAVVIAAFASVVSAQEVGGGFKVGVNRATLGGEVADAANAEAITGLAAGAFLRVALAHGFAIQPELMVARNGAHGDTLGIEGTVRLNYVEVPVLVRYSFLSGDVLIPTVFVGPTFRYRLSANVESDDGFSRGLDTVVKRSDFGWVFGAAVGIPTGGPELSVEARYMLGMTKIDDSGAGADIKNRAFAVLVGLCFDTGAGKED